MTCVMSSPHGCICPPTSEQTCRGFNCPRQKIQHAIGDVKSDHELIGDAMLYVLRSPDQLQPQASFEAAKNVYLAARSSIASKVNADLPPQSEGTGITFRSKLDGRPVSVQIYNAEIAALTIVRDTDETVPK
jgi:hypothetical protein